MIIQSPNRILKTISKVIDHGEDLKTIFDTMLKEQKISGGCGLAAPQVGYSIRLIWVCCSAYTGFIINPKILEKSGVLKKSVEGCLSLKGHKMVKVMRDRKILVSGFDQNWEPLGISAVNTSSAILQHEIDHLNGVTLLNYK